MSKIQIESICVQSYVHTVHSVLVYSMYSVYSDLYMSKNIATQIKKNLINMNKIQVETICVQLSLLVYSVYSDLYMYTNIATQIKKIQRKTKKTNNKTTFKVT